MEALGALAHAALPPLRWRPALARSGLPAWLAAALAPRGAGDDLALEAVVAAGALCQADTAALLAQAGVVRPGRHAPLSSCRGAFWRPCGAMRHGVLVVRQGAALVALLAERRDDDEFVLQTVLSLAAMLLHEPLRAPLLADTQARAPLTIPMSVHA